VISAVANLLLPLDYGIREGLSANSVEFTSREKNRACIHILLLSVHRVENGTGRSVPLRPVFYIYPELFRICGQK
jgi:hypothetical protein